MLRVAIRHSAVALAVFLSFVAGDFATPAEQSTASSAASLAEDFDKKLDADLAYAKKKIDYRRQDILDRILMAGRKDFIPSLLEIAKTAPQDPKWQRLVFATLDTASQLGCTDAQLLEFAEGYESNPSLAANALLILARDLENKLVSTIVERIPKNIKYETVRAAQKEVRGVRRAAELLQMLPTCKERVDSLILRVIFSDWDSYFIRSQPEMLWRLNKLKSLSLQNPKIVASSVLTWQGATEIENNRANTQQFNEKYRLKLLVFLSEECKVAYANLAAQEPEPVEKPIKRWSLRQYLAAVEKRAKKENDKDSLALINDLRPVLSGAIDIPESRWVWDIIRNSGRKEIVSALIEFTITYAGDIYRRPKALFALSLATKRANINDLLYAFAENHEKNPSRAYCALEVLGANPDNARALEIAGKIPKDAKDELLREAVADVFRVRQLAKQLAAESDPGNKAADLLEGFSFMSDIHSGRAEAVWRRNELARLSDQYPEKTIQSLLAYRRFTETGSRSPDLVRRRNQEFRQEIVGYLSEKSRQEFTQISPPKSSADSPAGE